MNISLVTLFTLILTLLSWSQPTKNILLCWSKPDHPHGTHDYEGFATFYAELLGKEEKFSTSIKKGFPEKMHWKSNDLIILNLTHNEMTKEELQGLDDYIKDGKSLIVIHQALTQRKTYDAWSKRIGLAYCFTEDETKSHWGSGELTLKMDTSHPILNDLPKEVPIKEELYWNLKVSDAENTRILGTTSAPRDSEKFNNCPVLWTKVHHVGLPNEARIFCCVIGHNNSFTEGEFFQLLMKNATHWSLKIK